jgi:hypothetical protein
MKIRLVKTEGVIGDLPVGTTILVNAPARFGERDAKVRAFRMLQRDHPKENPMCWEAQTV